MPITIYESPTRAIEVAGGQVSPVKVGDVNKALFPFNQTKEFNPQQLVEQRIESINS